MFVAALLLRVVKNRPLICLNKKKLRLGRRYFYDANKNNKGKKKSYNFSLSSECKKQTNKQTWQPVWKTEAYKYPSCVFLLIGVDPNNL